MRKTVVSSVDQVSVSNIASNDCLICSRYNDRSDSLFLTDRMFKWKHLKDFMNSFPMCFSKARGSTYDSVFLWFMFMAWPLQCLA